MKRGAAREPPGAPAALVIARAPSGSVKPELAPLLDRDRRAALQALLITRAAAWAEAAAPGAAYVAVEPAHALSAVAALLPAGVSAFAQPGGADDPRAAAIAHVGRGPLLIVGTDCPKLGPAHAAAVLTDLAAGCDVVIGTALEGGWYLAGLREPRPELLCIAPEAWERGAGITLVLGRARELGAEVGMLRHERLLVTPDDAAALLADPLLPSDLRAGLAA